MKVLCTILAGAVLASSFSPAGAGPRRRSPMRDFVAPMLEPPPPPVVVRPVPSSPADRAQSGYIEGASPWNPEGSSNPQIPTF